MSQNRTTNAEESPQTMLNNTKIMVILTAKRRNFRRYTVKNLRKNIRHRLQILRQRRQLRLMIFRMSLQMPAVQNRIPIQIFFVRSAISSFVCVRPFDEALMMKTRI